MRPHDRITRAPLAGAICLALALSLLSCGGDDDSGPMTSPRQEGGRPSAPSGERPSGAETASSPRTDTDSAEGPAAQFRTRIGDNSIQDFGAEAPASESAEAAAVLHAYLDARAAGNWAAACRQLATGLTDSFAQLSGGETGKRAPSCPVVLEALTAGLPRSALREAAEADVGSFRVEGDRAYLLYHGARKTDYFVPMVSAEGAWKVAAVAPSPLS